MTNDQSFNPLLSFNPIQLTWRYITQVHSIPSLAKQDCAMMNWRRNLNLSQFYRREFLTAFLKGPKRPAINPIFRRLTCDRSRRWDRIIAGAEAGCLRRLPVPILAAKLVVMTFRRRAWQAAC